MNKTTTIHEYIRVYNPKTDDFDYLTGCMVGTINSVFGSKVVTIGISARHPTDEVNKKEGYALALERAKHPEVYYKIHCSPNYVPKFTYYNCINQFLIRCARWFKNIPVLYPQNIEFTSYDRKKELFLVGKGKVTND